MLFDLTRPPSRGCRLIAASFNNEKAFQNALNTAFEHFINLSSRAPEYISLFMDDKLRKACAAPGGVLLLVSNALMGRCKSCVAPR